MQKQILYKMLLVVLTLGFPISVPADDFPSLPVDSNIKTGRLSNGITYYLVTNATEKGTADIALVQKVGLGNEKRATAGETTVRARGSFCDLPHFTEQSPFSYMNGNRILPQHGGYVDIYEDATIFRFKDLQMARSKEIVDSTLLMVFDMVGMQEGNMDRMYAPSNQAIVISGDIDATAVMNKMNMLSLLVTSMKADPTTLEYNWSEKSDEFVFDPSDPGVVSVSYSAKRTPQGDMSTVLPLVSEKFASEFGVMVKSRVSRYLRDKGIPVSSIDYKYLSSAAGCGDESYTITVHTSKDNMEAVAGALGSILSDINKQGTSAEEYKDTRNKYMVEVNNTLTSSVSSNEEYLEKCISSFLYGSSLASEAAKVEYLSKRNLGDQKSAQLFGNVISAILSKDKNRTITCGDEESPKVRRSIENAYNNAWDAAQLSKDGIGFIGMNADTTALEKSFPKEKIKSIAAEPVSGGEMWTFSNGTSVIYKKSGTASTFRYAWLLHGGWSLISGMKNAEGALVKDMFPLYGTGGMSAAGFRDMLDANGISMEANVTMSDMTISGSAPANKIQLLMKSLLAITGTRSIDTKAFDYYKKCHALGGESKESVDRAILDSLMNPSAGLPGRKTIKISDDLQKKAEKFFAREFSKMNDGMLVIVGNMDAELLKKELCKYMGGFKTDKVSMMRSRAQASPLTSKATLTEVSDKASMALKISAPLMFTTESYAASSAAAYAVMDVVAAQAAACGWSANGYSEYEMFPEERIDIYMDLKASALNGLPASMVQVEDAATVAERVNGALEELESKGLPKKEALVYKSRFDNWYNSRSSDPDMTIRNIVLRYSYGKDVTTKYKEKIATVDDKAVNNFIMSFSKGSMAEYVVKPERIGEHLDTENITEPTMPKVPDSMPAVDSLSRMFYSLFVKGFEGSFPTIGNGKADFETEAAKVIEEATKNMEPIEITKPKEEESTEQTEKSEETEENGGTDEETTTSGNSSESGTESGTVETEQKQTTL